MLLLEELCLLFKKSLHRDIMYLCFLRNPLHAYSIATLSRVERRVCSRIEFAFSGRLFGIDSTHFQPCTKALYFLKVSESRTSHQSLFLWTPIGACRNFMEQVLFLLVLLYSPECVTTVTASSTCRGVQCCNDTRPLDPGSHLEIGRCTVPH